MAAPRQSARQAAPDQGSTPAAEQSPRVQQPRQAHPLEDHPSDGAMARQEAPMDSARSVLARGIQYRGRGTEQRFAPAAEQALRVQQLRQARDSEGQLSGGERESVLPSQEALLQRRAQPSGRPHRCERDGGRRREEAAMPAARPSVPTRREYFSRGPPEGQAFGREQEEDMRWEEAPMHSSRAGLSARTGHLDRGSFEGQPLSWQRGDSSRGNGLRCTA